MSRLYLRNFPGAVCAEGEGELQPHSMASQRERVRKDGQNSTILAIARDEEATYKSYLTVFFPGDLALTKVICRGARQLLPMKVF